MVFARRKVEAVFDDAPPGQIEFQRVGRVAARHAQAQQHAQRLPDIMRHAVQVNVVAEDFVEIGYGKQHFPIGQTGAVGGGGTDAVDAFGKFRALVEMVHPRAVFLAKRNLPLVAHGLGDVVAQGAKGVVVGKARQRFGMGGAGEILCGGVGKIVETGKRIVLLGHGVRPSEKKKRARL